MRTLAIMLAVGLSGCHPSDTGAETSNTEMAVRRDSIPSQAYTKIGSAFGVLTLADSYERGDTVRFYNDDGSLWYKFTYYYDDSDGQWDYPNEAFRPRAFHPDYFTLTLDVVEDLGTQYRVIVNATTGLEKLIPKERFLRFRTWEQYVLNVFAIDHDDQQNPVRSTPGGQPSATPPGANDRLQPVKIEGDWLQVKWGSEGSWSFGWVRWREGDRLVLYIFHFA